MPYALKPTARFLQEFSSLDNSIRIIVRKKLERIKQNPKLSKPLKHEANIYSERIKGYRIVFEVIGREIFLYHVLKRDDSYSA